MSENENDSSIATLDGEMSGEMSIETKSYMHVPFLEFKMDEKAGTFEGYASTFGNVDLGGDVCDKGCFDATLLEHKKNDTMPGLYYFHSEHEPVGDWVDWSANGKGLPMKGELWIGKGIPRAEQEYMRLKSKGPKGLSIGYRTKKFSFDADKKIRHLQEVSVVETSLVPFGMNPKAKITNVKSCLHVDGMVLSKRQLDHILREVGGLSLTQAKAAVRRVWEAISNGEVPQEAEIKADELNDLLESVRRNIALLRK